jgi:SAM-dependent methyltransferase
MNKQPGMSIDRFMQDYEGQAAWDVGKPQEFFVNTLTQNKPQSPVLDMGCGTGDLSIFTANLGCDVLGIDFASKAIELASNKTNDMPSSLSFKVYDAFKLDKLNIQFGTILDCFFFHMLDDEARIQYASILHSILKPGGKLYMLSYAVALPIPDVPRAISKDDITTTFTNGWDIKELGEITVDSAFSAKGFPGTYACIEKCT